MLSLHVSANRQWFVQFGTVTGNSFGSRQGGRDCAETRREDGETGSAGTAEPPAVSRRGGRGGDRGGGGRDHPPRHHPTGARRARDGLPPISPPGEPACQPGGRP